MKGLHLTKVSHAYDGVLAVDGVDLQVAPGEIVCLLGPSGCGKSTVLRLAAGLEDLQRGSITIDEAAVSDADSGAQVPPEARGVGLMFQDYALFPHLTVQENIAFGLTADKAEKRRIVAGALAEVDLSDVAERYPHTLSGGQQQRIALLRAVVPQPRVMLLDEPFSGLDQYMRQQVRQETLRVLKSAQAATLMVTHDPEEALYLADRVVVMQAGRVVQDSAPLELYQNPQSPFVARLFGPANEFHANAQNGAVVTPLGQFTTDLEGEVLVIVRASDIEVHDAPQPGSTQHAVRSARPLGAVSELILEGANGPIEVQSDIQQLPASGSTVHALIDAQRVFVYLKP